MNSYGGEVCACESQSRGEIGPVGNDERVGRVVTHPFHFTKKGELKPGVFPPSHIAGNGGGLSLLRVDKLNTAELNTIASAIAGTKEDAQLRGLLLGQVARLREIVDDEGIRSLCVIDDPIAGDDKMPDNPAHAVAVRSGEQDASEVERIRIELLDLFSDVTAVADVHPA